MEKKSKQNTPEKKEGKFYYKEIKTHPYDLDIRKVLNEAKIEIKKRAIHTDKQKDKPVEELERLIKTYCRQGRISYEFNPALIIKCQNNFYIMALSMALIYYDQLKIDAFLDYQAKNYKGKDDFVDVVEHNIYKIVNSNSPFKDKNTTLERIQSWVNNSRNNQQTTHSDKTRKPFIKKRLGMPAIAYIYQYLSLTDPKYAITTDNSDDIAAAYDYTSPTSGHKLRQNYTLFKKTVARISFIEGNKNSERQRNNVFKNVHAYFIDKKISGRALEKFKSDYKAFSEKKFKSDLDFIDL